MAHLAHIRIFSLTCCAVAAIILLGFLIVRPPIHHAAKLWLLLGLGIFPIAAAASGNISGYQTTETRAFCGSCHVMSRHAADSEDPHSNSLAARHARNRMFGSENCYTCHADYGMYGTILTKIGGMRHVWLYYTEYRTIPVDQALQTIHLRRPFPNDNCMQCHSTDDELWLRVKDHQASLEDVRRGRISCASAGCHGFAHPFDKPAPK